MKITSYSMSFHGELLKRGFWLYVWDIRTEDVQYLYVGRTGDSSSCNAASPFQRIGQHLDFRENAKGNSLAKQLRKVSILPECCTFEMLAIGPLFPEQENFDGHKPIRDIVGSLESALADHLRSKGYSVIGNHFSSQELDNQLWDQVVKIADNKFVVISKSP